MMGVPLVALLAGCGSQLASGATTSSGSGAAGTTSSTTATGCASVNDATNVTVLRAMHLVEPTRIGDLEKTQTDAAKVRALLRDFCAVIAHPDHYTGRIMCPAEIGVSYSGTFYDGTRKLATFTFGASGCETVSVTAASTGAKPQKAVVIGTAASAAPNLHTDLDHVLGLPDTAVFLPQTHVNQGAK
jgi:hypothetical protein